MHELGIVAGKVDALQERLRTAQADVLASAKTHLKAAKELERVTAEHLAAKVCLSMEKSPLQSGTGVHI